MADTEPSPYQQLDDHYGTVGFRLVVTKDDDGPGMTDAEAGAFLRALRPVVRAGQTLGQAAKKVVKLGG